MLTGKKSVPCVKTEHEARIILSELNASTVQDDILALCRLREKARWHSIPLLAAVEQYGDPRTWEKLYWLNV